MNICKVTSSMTWVRLGQSILDNIFFSMSDVNGVNCKRVEKKNSCLFSDINCYPKLLSFKISL